MTTIALDWASHIRDSTVKSCEPSALDAYRTALDRLRDFETGYLRIGGVYIDTIGETKRDESNPLMQTKRYKVSVNYLKDAKKSIKEQGHFAVFQIAYYYAVERCSNTMVESALIDGVEKERQVSQSVFVAQ